VGSSTGDDGPESYKLIIYAFSSLGLWVVAWANPGDILFGLVEINGCINELKPSIWQDHDEVQARYTTLCGGTELGLNYH
jgi:hypothetical protein